MKTFLKTVNINKRINLDTLEYPVTVYLKVTSCCNLNCNFCSQYNNPKKNMNIDKAKKLLNELKEAGVVSLNYTGGEPLVYPDIEDLLKYGHDLGFEQVLITNGLELFNKRKILKYINSIGISIHGPEEIHDSLCGKKGTLKKVKDNIDYVLKEHNNININLNYTLTKNNINRKYIEDVNNYNINKKIKLCFGRLNYLGLSKDENIINPNDYLAIISDLKKTNPNISISNCIPTCQCAEEYKYLTHACGAGITMFSIEADGDLRICASSNYSLGNVFNNSFQKLINKKEIKTYKSLEWLPNICRICKDFEHCKGGCHAEDNSMFYNNTCDALINNELNNAWNKIKNSKLQILFNKIKKEGKEYLIIKIPLRKIDKNGYKIIEKIDGTKTGEDIIKGTKIENIKDFLCTLYLDRIIGVKDEEKNNR